MSEKILKSEQENIELLNDAYGPRPLAVAHLDAQKLAAQDFYEADSQIHHVPPSAISGHYPHNWLWDGAKNAEVYARYGYFMSASNQVKSILASQHPNGFIPNMTFANDGRKLDIERRTFTNPHKSSDYSQPAIIAEAVREIYEGCKANGQELEGKDFLREVYPSLKMFYQYFLRERQVSPENYLIFNIHPCETGRDSDPTFNFIQYKKPFCSSGEDTPTYKIAINSAADYIGNVALGFRNKKHGWQADQAHQTFKFCDVMFNCLFAKNLRDLALIAEENNEFSDAIEFHNHAEKLSHQIQQKMYIFNPDDEKFGFYGINLTGFSEYDIEVYQNNNLEPGDPVFFKSISNLFPLVLDGLETTKLAQIIDLIEKEFTDNFMIPTVSTKSPDYDPNYRGRNMWQGPIWLWMNDFVISGIADQLSRPDVSNNRDLVRKLSNLHTKLMTSSKELVTYKNNSLHDRSFIIKAVNKFIPHALRSQSNYDGPYQNFAEFFSPQTGVGYRTRPFAGSSIACRKRQY